MRIALFYHSLISDWNHGNAHFLRGVVSELLDRGHDVQVYEPSAGWSLENLRREYGERALSEFEQAFPQLRTNFYDLPSLDVDEVLDSVDVAIVHEWSDHELVQRIGKHRVRNNYLLLFHDTHHRAVTDAHGIAGYDLEHFDGVLAFGEVIRQIYLKRGWSRRAWTWHEAADMRLFVPAQQAHPGSAVSSGLVWIGNWGDEERTQELSDYLMQPVRELGLNAEIYGVRYPQSAVQSLASAGIRYHGWVPNYRVPQVFARFAMTAHIPRRPYRTALPGIPTIRVFEALACGIPLVSAPWDDIEGLFTPGKDFLMARNPEQMTEHYRTLLSDSAMCREIAAHGLATIRSRHTCAHRVDELLDICRQLTGVEECRSLSLDPA